MKKRIFGLLLLAVLIAGAKNWRMVDEPPPECPPPPFRCEIGH